MGVIASRLRRHRRQRLAAELACTWTPRRLFPLGTEQGGVYYPDDPNSLLRRVNLLSATATLSTQSITATPRQQTLSFKGTGTVTLSGASTAGPLVGTGAGNRVSLTFTPTAASLTLTVTGTVTEAQLELGSAFTTYQPVTTWTDDYMAAVGHIVTQFTDSAGTTPVTKVTDPVGFTMDRRFGGYRGPELCPYASGFSSTSGITVASATVALNGSTLEVTSTGAAGNNYAVVPAATGLTTGDTFEVAVRAKRGAQGTQQKIATFTFASTTARTVTNSGSYVTYSWRVVATATSGSMRIMVADAAGAVGDMLSVESISIRKMPGNHRIQATSGSRKTLSARVNLLTKSEQFDDAAWTKTDTTVTADNTTAPNGTTTADLLTEGATLTATVQQGITSVASGFYRARRVIKRGNHDWTIVGLGDNLFNNGVRQWINLATGAKGTQNTFGAGGATFSSCTVEDLGSGWYAVNLAGQIGASTVFRTYTHSAASDGSTVRVSGATRYEWGADLRTADDAAKAIPAYQRVNTASDYDTDGFPHYWLYDGTDDSDATASTVDGSASDKVTVIAGVTKNSDAAVGMFLEHTTSVGALNGGFYIAAPAVAASTHYGFATRGTSQPTVRYANNYAAPASAVLSAAYNNATGTAAQQAPLWVNGVTPSSISDALSPTTAANYVNATEYWGRRAGSTLPFNGREYVTILRFGPMSDSERNQAERWVAQRMGVTI